MPRYGKDQCSNPQLVSKSNCGSIFTHLKALGAGYTTRVLKASWQIQAPSPRWTRVVGESTGIYVDFTVLSHKSLKKE